MGEEVIDPENPPGAKLTGWEQRLTAFLRENRNRTFETGRWDCAVWSAGAVQAITGVDHLRGFRGYRTEAEGLRKLQAKGFADLAAFASAHFEELPVPMKAQPGDLVLIADSLGIVQGPLVYLMGRGRDGQFRMGTQPLSRVERAWRT